MLKLIRHSYLFENCCVLVCRQFYWDNRRAARNFRNFLPSSYKTGTYVFCFLVEGTELCGKNGLLISRNAAFVALLCFALLCYAMLCFGPCLIWPMWDNIVSLLMCTVLYGMFPLQVSLSLAAYRLILNGHGFPLFFGTQTPASSIKENGRLDKGEREMERVPGKGEKKYMISCPA